MRLSGIGSPAGGWLWRLMVCLAVAAMPGLLGPAIAAAEEVGAADQVDINRATISELTGLPGIGEATAKRIVEFREQHGSFERVEDLMKVKGIGEKSFQKLRPLITVAPSGRG